MAFEVQFQQYDFWADKHDLCYYLFILFFQLFHVEITLQEVQRNVRIIGSVIRGEPQLYDVSFIFLDIPAILIHKFSINISAIFNQQFDNFRIRTVLCR